MDRAAAFKRRRPEAARRPRYGRIERNYGEFRRAAAQMPREIDNGHLADAARHTPSPIFRIRLAQWVPYDGFKKSPEPVSIETISPETEMPDYRVVEGGGGNAGRLYRQIERWAASRCPTLADAIAPFDGANPRKKIGGSLERHPVGGGLDLVDVDAWRLGYDALKALAGQMHRAVVNNGGRIMDMYRTRDTFVAKFACDAALSSTVAGLREVVTIDRPLRAVAGDHASRSARKIAAAAGSGDPMHRGRPRTAAAGLVHSLGPANGPPAASRRAPPAMAGLRSHQGPRPRPPGAGIQRRTDGRTR